MLEEHGYNVLTATPWYLPSRTFFLCLPHRSNGLASHWVNVTDRNGGKREQQHAEWAELRTVMDGAQEEARRQHARVTAAERRLRESEERVARLREQLDMVHASWRWRTGGFFTRPAGSVRRLVRQWSSRQER
jgi:hypothetical protein